MWISQLLLILLCALIDAQPTGLSDPASLNPVEVASNTGNNRDQRSPQFGLLDADYSDYDVEEERTFDHHRKHKHHKHKPDGYNFYPSGQYGGYRPEYHPQPSVGGSFATASAGSVDSYGKPVGQSQANAQSASFSFGPYSASFSVAEASSGSQNY
ncbi:uncharacterized protein LOC105663714 [Megachile rotundata]|uniref:uncharacterized protein LOC105663714 n=1 Tax=Megachile rotundata TaxID=143995 RepID=UPI000614BAB6|nr:PREDICTED: uncharacterized protein LOC105663714 [Megachile rotundata]